MEKEYLACRYEALKIVSKLLISDAERLFDALETRNLNDFKYACTFLLFMTIIVMHANNYTGRF
jgi:hypothetical protein